MSHPHNSHDRWVATGFLIISTGFLLANAVIGSGLGVLISALVALACIAVILEG